MLTARFAAFVQHAWNPDTGDFATSWASIGPGSKTTAPRIATDGRCGRWVNARAAMPVRHGVDGRPPCSPRHCRPRKPFIRPARRPSRCWVWTLIARRFPTIAAPGKSGISLADRLMSGLRSVETPDWQWFEESLAYDNARLPQALIVTGMATQTPGYVDAGLRSLRWLMTQQTTSTGCFRPVGTASFGEIRKPPRAFDQQPVEATATICRLPVARGARTTTSNGRPSQPGFSPGFSAATTCRSRSSIPRPAVAAMDCIPTAPTKTGGRVRRVLSAGPRRNSSARARQCQLDKSRGDSRHRRLIECPFRPTEGTLLHATFLNRQALYLRPDPARVIVRPFKPATEPARSQPDRQDARQPYRRARSRTRSEGCGQPAGGCAT